jgi:hypothetical protein
VVVNETPAVPETGGKAGIAKWKGSGSTKSSPAAGSGAVYGLGIIGALVYFVGTAETRTDCVLAVGKAIVWPAILVHLAFKRLND